MHLYRQGTDLVITQKGTGNKITVYGQFTDGTEATSINHIPTIEFADGTVWNTQTIKQKAVLGTGADDTIYGFVDADEMHGGSGNDTLYGANGDDTLYGEAGDDKLYGEVGNDRLHGGEGNDTLIGGLGDDLLYGGVGQDKLSGNEGDDILYGEAGQDRLEGGDGNDTLIGGIGNDHLLGGSGSDTYVFTAGWGQDVIEGEWSKTAADTDTIHFTDVTPDALLVRNENGNMVIRRMGSDDQITVQQQFNLDATTQANINQITFADGTVWDADTLNKMAVKGTAAADHIQGVTQQDVIHGGDGNDVIAATRSGYGKTPYQNQVFGDVGDDTLSGDGLLDGGMGNDTLNGNGQLYGRDGDDLLEGSGLLDGGSGNDTLNGHGQLYGQDGDDTLTGSGALYGGAGSDTLVLTGSGSVMLPIEGDDTQPWASTGTPNLLDGGAGNDTLDASRTPMKFGSNGAACQAPQKADPLNILRGGKGNDTIYGSGDNDVYEFALGDGQDIIIERKADQAYTNTYASYDIVRFGAGIAAADISYLRRGDDLILQHRNGSDSITVQNHYNSTNTAANHFKMNEIQFADSTLLTDSQFDSMVTWYGTDAADQMLGYRDSSETIRGGLGDDQIFARDGNDTLYGDEGNDYLDGEAGNDTLFGGTGNDSLLGGTGNDILNGGAGNDRYMYRPGDGADVIDQSGGGRDILFFMNGIGKERLSFSQDGNDLLILVDKDPGQSVRVKDHFLGGEKAIGMAQPDGGYAITAAAITQIIKAQQVGGNYDTVVDGTEAADSRLLGSNGDDLIRGFGGDDKLFGFGGDDRLEGGAGNDYLSGGNGSGSGSGNDTLVGGDGNDTLVGEDGNDLLIGGLGNDQYIYQANGGVDTIDNSGGGNDGVFFNGIAVNRISFHRDQNDLVMLVDKDLGQQVRVKDHFLDGDKAISYVQPGSGYSISKSQITAKLTALPSGGTGTPPNPVEPGKTINGTDGNDTLQGGTGNDTLSGGKGNDTYIYTAGSDVINENGGTDTLVFSNGITFNQVSNNLMKSGDNLVLKVNGSDTNKVTLTNFFLGGDNLVETIRFESGGSISAEQIFNTFGLSMPTTNPGNSYDQTITGSAGNDTNLSGGSGNDLIQGLGGDDVLEGGAGNDTLLGGGGNDTYVFNAGFGQDTIDNTGGGNDTIYFDGIDFNQVSSGLTKMNDDLILKVSGTSDQITIIDWFKGGEKTVQKITFASGGSISADQLFAVFGMENPNVAATAGSVNSMINAMSAFGSGNMLMPMV